MTIFKDKTLRQKLTALTMVCSILALATTAVALGAYEWFFYRKTLVSHLTTLSSLTARNSSAALAFANSEDAMRVLSALAAEPVVTGAALYDTSGNPFALYRRPDVNAAIPEVAPVDGQVQRGSDLAIALPVAEAKRFGTLLVCADLSALTDRIGAYLLVLLGTTAMSGLLAFLLTGRLAQRIVAPVHALVGAALAVRTKADYSIRVPKVETDELGTLTDAFNDMLARVQQNETDLYRNAERLRLALESAKIGTWDWNLVRDEVVWSDRNYEIFGVEPGTPITSEVFYAQVHPDDRPRVKSAIENAMQTARDFSAEFRLAQPERPPHYVAARGLFLKSPQGELQRAVGVTIDVTERRGAELRVIESEVRFRAVAERAPALIWSCDQALKRDYFNKTWLSFTGRPLEKELGDGWRQDVPDADITRWKEMVGAAAALRDPYSIEYRLRRADGALRWVIETGSPRQSADGSFAGYLGSCIDITARKENEAELEAHVRMRTHELQVANQELESFSYSVSHDLRSPVRAIQGFTEIAVEELQAGNLESALERLGRVTRAAERMNKLIDAFISMAGISRAEIKLDEVDLSRLAEEVVAFLRAANPERQVEVVVAPGIACTGDERLLRIALENLLSNAWKFTSKQDAARIEFGEMEKEGARVFFVRDNGAGFDAALAHKLFRAFERLHSGAQFEGLGVGLSTVQRVIDKHRGRIWAESAEGRGATFYFTVPEPPAKSASVAAA